MDANDIMIQKIRKAAVKKILFLPHALRQMMKPERMILASEVRHVVINGTIIENYPKDPRGQSCLLLGFSGENRPIHVVCSPKEEYLAIITSYIPDPSEWSTNFCERSKK